MQTLTDLAKEIIRWERLTLSRGAYRIHNMGVLQGEAPRVDRCKECSYDDWFADDLIYVKAALGLSGGVWCGKVSGEEPRVTVLALRME